MRICHVTDFLPVMHRIAGGAEYAVQRILDEQGSLGLDIDVVTTRRDRPERAAGARRHFEIGIADRVAPRALFAWKNFFAPIDPIAARAVTRALRASRPDVVHFHNLHFASLAPIRSARQLGLPTVLSIYDYWILCPSFMLRTSSGDLCTRGHGPHCVDCMGTRRLRPLKPVKRALFGIRPSLVRRLVSCVDRFVVLSAPSKALLERHGIPGGAIHVIPQYIWKEAGDRPLSRAPDPNRIAYVGWIEERKGLHVVIEAVGILKRQGVTVTLDVLGLTINDDYRARIDRLIAAEGIADRVTFSGRQSREALLDAFDRVSAIVIPEQWENMSPVVLTEAMAAGKCVVASRVGGIPSFVEHMTSGLLAERDRAQDFAEKIGWAVANPDRVRELGAAARAQARSCFDPDDINRRTLDLYRQLTSRT